MNLRIDGQVYVTLSERNLRDLWQQFIGVGTASLWRWTEFGGLHITVESNADHYGTREPGPGGFPQNQTIEPEGIEAPEQETA